MLADFCARTHVLCCVVQHASFRQTHCQKAGRCVRLWGMYLFCVVCQNKQIARVEGPQSCVVLWGRSFGRLEREERVRVWCVVLMGLLCWCVCVDASVPCWCVWDLLVLMCLCWCVCVDASVPCWCAWDLLVLMCLCWCINAMLMCLGFVSVDVSVLMHRCPVDVSGIC